ncbi:MAG TPA: sigma factor, partial [Acidimicrobiales bacterium]|nr:sigma factor [Acidimicrobiales bacterium]
MDLSGVGAAELEITLQPTVARSFDAEYAQRYAPLVRLLWSLTGSWALAEEIAQEAFVAAYRSWPTVSALDRSDLWIRRVAINRAISVHRKLVSEAAALTRVRTPSAVEPQFSGEDEQLWKAVRKLPRRQAAAVVLSTIEGLTAEEVGSVLDCSGET